MKHALDILRSITDFISLLPVKNFILKNEVHRFDFSRFMNEMISRECSGRIQTNRPTQFIQFDWQRLSDAYDDTTDNEYGWGVTVCYGGGDEIFWQMPKNVAELMITRKA